MSLVRLHRQRILAEAGARAAVAAPARTGAAATEYELMRARLGVDLRRLKEIQSIERKIELKRELLPEYVEWVAGVLAADVSAQDDVAVQVMIWSIDVGAWSDAIPLVRHVLRHELALPERFMRTPATMITEEIAEAALKTLGKGETEGHVSSAMLADLETVEVLVADQDMFDQVRAKLEKAIGLAQVKLAEAMAADADGPAGGRRARLTRGLARLRRAYELDATSGVKGQIDRLERELAKDVPPPEGG